MNNRNYRHGLISLLTLGFGTGSLAIGAIVGILAGLKVELIVLALVSLIGLMCFFFCFEQMVIGLLILRTSMDMFSDQQLPAVFGVGVIGLTFLYLIVQLLTRKPIQTDWLWWFLATWFGVQLIWVILLPLGGSGLEPAYLSTAIREWIRILSWLMVYLLVMQLKGLIHPAKLTRLLFFGLVIPIIVALLQILLPPSALPSFMVFEGQAGAIEAGTRINASFGHPNTFTSFLFLFIGLTYWRQEFSKPRYPWLILLGFLAFIFVSTKALFGLMMLGTFMMCITLPKLSFTNLIGAVFIVIFVIVLFGSTEFGQERLGSIAETPLLNPDLDLWKAILLSKGDGNSFNWRLSQWHYLLTQWQDYPWLGFGLGTGKYVSTNGLEPHNDYVRALVEGGIIGLTTFLAFIVGQMIRLMQLIFSAPRGSPQYHLCLTLLMLLIGLCVGMLTENIWTHTALFLYWFALLGIAGWDWNEPETPNLDHSLRDKVLSPASSSQIR